MKNQIEQRVDLFSKVIGWIRNIRKQIQIALQVLTKETCVSVQKVFHQCVLPVHRLKRILLIGQPLQFFRSIDCALQGKHFDELRMGLLFIVD